MTRKDYELIARAVKISGMSWEKGATPDTVIREVAGQLAYTLELENPRFDRARFLAACGVK
jgi:hypothetical protein